MARDTITDFVNYLSKKESLIESGKLAFAAGEEDLLAYYLSCLNPDDEHDFLIPPPYTALIAEEGEWERFSSSPERLSQFQADEVSYLWDHLIEKFTFHFMTGTSAFCSDPTYANLERLLRFFAKESRFRRRMLSSALLGAFEKGKQADRLLRVSPPQNPGQPYYVFLTLKPDIPVFESAERYREIRLAYLQCVCKVVRLVHKDAADIVGFAIEPMGKPGEFVPRMPCTSTRGNGPRRWKPRRRSCRQSSKSLQTPPSTAAPIKSTPSKARPPAHDWLPPPRRGRCKACGTARARAEWSQI